MSNVTGPGLTKPKTVDHSPIITTTDYSVFKTLDGNRDINGVHLARLMASMKEKYLFTVIIVNEHREIIDGQHRFMCIKELELPLYYVICKGYGLSDVHRFNQVGKKWSPADYLRGYCDLQYPNYLRYRDFENKYGFGHTENLLLLTGSSSKEIGYTFTAGTFKIKNYRDACDKAEKLLMLIPYYNKSGVKRRSFVLCMHGMFRNPNFEFTEFIAKLKIQPTALQDCVKVEQYKLLIEEIYNYRRKSKVNLRFFDEEIDGADDNDPVLV